MNRMRTVLGMACVIALVGVACGGDDDGGDEPTDGATTTEPAESFTIGFTNPLASNDQLNLLQQAIEARAEFLGHEVIGLDSNLDTNKQVSDIDQLVAQGVDAIIVFPLDQEAIDPPLQRAIDAGIRLVGINATLFDPEATSATPYDAAVNQGEEQMATETADFVIGELGGTGNVLGVGLGFPVPTIEYQMQVMEEVVTEGGLTWLGRVDNPTDDAAGAQPVVEQALLRFDDVDAIMNYNDPSAIGAVAAVQSAGLEGEILITGANGVALEQVASGEIAASWDLLPWLQGICYVNVMEAILKGEEVPVTTVVPVQMITSDNVSEILDWDTAVEQIRAGELTECTPPA
jgi:ribose transport system substrate-binding protein